MDFSEFDFIQLPIWFNCLISNPNESDFSQYDQEKLAEILPFIKSFCEEFDRMMREHKAIYIEALKKIFHLYCRLEGFRASKLGQDIEKFILISLNSEVKGCNLASNESMIYNDVFCLKNLIKFMEREKDEKTT